MSSLLVERLQHLQIPPVLFHYFSAGVQADGMLPGELARYQLESLQALVHRAYDKSPFYREKLSRAGVRPEEIQRLDDLQRLPFLTKEELRGRPWLLLTCDRKDIALVQVSTGTTGGEEIYMAYTWNDYLLNDLMPRYTRLFPVGPGDLCLNALPYEMSTAGLAFHKTFMEGYQAAVLPAGKGGAYSTAAKTVKMIQDLHPNVVVTSPSWAILLAEEADRREFDLRSLGLKKMWLTGEGCSPALRQRVEQLYGTRANFFYGSLECGVLGIECDQHSGYHLAQAHALMELVDPRTGGPVKPGEVGEIVVTALLRYDSPILRFRTGDLGVLEPEPCTCGVSLSRFHMRGRAQDQLRFQDRAFSPMFLEEMLLRMPEVGNWFQFVKPGERSTHLEVRCELAKGCHPSAELVGALTRRLEASLGVPVRLQPVDQLPRPTTKVARIVQE